MRKLISRKARAILLIVPAVLFLGSVTMSLYFHHLPATRAITRNIYGYTQEADLVYRVYYNKNPFFPEAALPSGQPYLAAFVNNVNTFFTYRFSGDGPAAISGSYNVKATIVATQGQNKEVMWTKDFVLVPDTRVSSSSGTLVLQKVLPIDYQAFAGFVAGLDKTALVAPDSVNMTVSWNVQIFVQAGGKANPVQISPKLTIPVSAGSFQITGDTTPKPQPGTITTSVSVPVANLPLLRWISSGASVFFLLGLVVTLVFTTAPKAPRRETANLQSILRKHGSRMARTSGDEVQSVANSVFLPTLEDLVKVADEVTKPILYRPGAEGTLFYLYDSSIQYCYMMEETPAEPPPA